MSIYYDDTADIETVKLDQNEETLTGTKTLVTTDKVMQKLNPGGASRDVILSAITNDLLFIIHNSGTVATFNLVVKNPAAATLATLGPGMTGVFHCGVAWDVLAGANQEYKTIYIDASEMIPCTTSSALQGTNEYGTNDIDIDYFAFDAGATEERVQFKLKLPENWDRGTIKAKFDWSSASGSTAGDTVEWGIKAGALSNDDAIDAALGTPQVISDILLANNGTDLQTTSATPALTIGGSPAVGDIIVFEIYRNTDGTDDMAEDAWLFGVTLQIKLSGIVNVW